MRTGVFGGAFDPPHAGHREAARAFITSGAIDRLLIVPAFQAPHKSSHVTPFDDRIAMCRLNFLSLSPAVEISAIEQSLPVPNFTIRTMNALREQFPNDTFVLCMGADSLQQLHTWRSYEELVERYPLLIAARPGSDLNYVPVLNKAQISFAGNQLMPESSTQVRASLEDALENNSLLPEVAVYIAENGLYR